MTDFNSDLIGQRNQRLEKLKKLNEIGIDPYPAKCKKQYTNKHILEKFEGLNGKETFVTGRVVSLRNYGKIAFAHIQDQSGKIQLYFKKETYEPRRDNDQHLNWNEFNLLDIGDFVEANGTITKTDRGEISILVKKVRILAKAIRPLPDKWHGLSDIEERFRRRYVDMTINPEVRERFIRRSKFWSAHRKFFDKNGFTEINIPILEKIPGGGDAEPFVTHMNALDEDFYLRISHELPLKRLIGGGYDKVYDIGARFRNEGLSDEHLPEHIAMEFYWAYADWKDGMEFVKELMNFVIEYVYKDKKQFKIRGFDVDFNKGWETIDFGEIIKKNFDIDAYNPNIDQIKKKLQENNIKYESNINIPRGIDALWKSIRKTISGPTFLINHPKYLSPLQKPSIENPNIVERFQPIIAGSELGNGWSELNNPIEQFERFSEQQKLRDSGDKEAQWLDVDYVEMLEYGMPPTFGYGHSERTFWFLEDVTAREGVPFPQMRTEIDPNTKKIYGI